MHGRHRRIIGKTTAYIIQTETFQLKILVTIGVCARNCEKSVGQVIERISGQDFPHASMEVIFVEEGSHDHTLSEILQRAPKMNIKYQVLHQDWKGLGFSRNVVLTNAHGDYVVWVDDGTIIPKDYIRKQVEFMERHANVGIARGFIGDYSGSNLVSTLENMGQTGWSFRNAGKMTSKLPAASGSVFRVEAAKEVGGFDEAIIGAAEDTDIAYRILRAGWKFFITTNGFLIEYNTKFKQVWKKSLWYGYGAHYIVHKHSELRDIIYKSSPLAGLVQGVPTSILVYKTTGKKIAFILPIWFFLKRTGYNIGFLRGHFDGYGCLQ
jgi:glycosyltransferase involved in cell wall biosynthesis